MNDKRGESFYAPELDLLPLLLNGSIRRSFLFKEAQSSNYRL